MGEHHENHEHQCFICYEEFSPKLTKVHLECNHSICSKCVRMIMTDDLKMSCPMCRSNCTISVEELKKSFNTGEEILEFLQKSVQKPLKICNYCEIIQSEHACQECELQLCEVCWDLIHRKGRLMHHKKCSVLECKSRLCPIHTKYYTDILCDDTDLICIMCERSAKYKDKKTQPIYDLIPSYIEEINKKLDESEDKLSSLSDYFTKLNKQDIEKLKSLSTIDILEYFADYRKKLDDLETNLMSEMAAYYENQANNLENYKDNIYDYLISKGRTVNMIKSNVTNLDEYNLVLNYKEYLEKLDDVVSKSPRLNEINIGKLELSFSDVDFSNICKFTTSQLSQDADNEKSK